MQPDCLIAPARMFDDNKHADSGGPCDYGPIVKDAEVEAVYTLRCGDEGHFQHLQIITAIVGTSSLCPMVPSHELWATVPS